MSARPCKKPRVTVDPRTPGDDRHDATCHVPGCAWTYPADKQFMALKSDAEDSARRHRAEHRAGVPSVAVERTGPGFTALCDGCDTGKYAAGRSEINEWVAHHLATEHGVVTQP